MNKVILIVALFLFFSLNQAYSQGLLPNQCGIRFSYDAAGNLIEREFICNNLPYEIFKVAEDKENKDNLKKPDQLSKAVSDEVIKVSAIMPNPTTGKFVVRLSQPLLNANVLLLDVNGKVLEKKISTGNILSFDISSQPSGMYLVRIDVAGKTSTFKVIKQ